MSEVVIVCDKTPVHVNIGTVLEEEEFNGAYLLRMATYSECSIEPNRRMLECI